MKLRYDVEGISSIKKKFDKFGQEGARNVKDITKIRALSIKADAQTTARNKGIYDTGKLVQGIVGEKIDNFNWEVIATEPYSAYMEFGTGRLVEVPTELEQIAIKFKGKGIREVNIPARPYLYPAFKLGRSLYLKDLRKSYIDLIKKYNR